MNIDVVVVTFNRLDKLKKTLSNYDRQSVRFRNLIVVNNNSSDGTREYLEEWQRARDSNYGKYVVTLPENVGGAGGFHAGQEYALKLKPDWIFVADDDAYPDTDLMKNFILFMEDNDSKEIAAVCGAVYNVDGTIDISHRERFVRKYGIIDIGLIPLEEYKRKSFEAEIYSYVGTFLNAEKLRIAGTCNPDYFIYYDDTEHSVRMRKQGKIIVVTSIKIVHDFGKKADDKKEKYLSWRHYYACRNYAHMLNKHFGLQGYFFSLVHFIRITFYYSKHLPTYKMLINGLYDGLKGNLGKHNVYGPGFTFNIN